MSSHNDRTLECPPSRTQACDQHTRNHCPSSHQNYSTTPSSNPSWPWPAIGNSNHPADLVAFHHAALFSPTLDTLETAITNQCLPPLPGLTLHTLHKHRPSLGSHSHRPHGRQTQKHSVNQEEVPQSQAKRRRMDSRPRPSRNLNRMNKP